MGLREMDQERMAILVRTFVNNHMQCIVDAISEKGGCSVGFERNEETGEITPSFHAGIHTCCGKCHQGEKPGATEAEEAGTDVDVVSELTIDVCGDDEDAASRLNQFVRKHGIRILLRLPPEPTEAMSPAGQDDSI